MTLDYVIVDEYADKEYEREYEISYKELVEALFKITSSNLCKGKTDEEVKFLFEGFKKALYEIDDFIDFDKLQEEFNEDLKEYFYKDMLREFKNENEDW